MRSRGSSSIKIATIAADHVTPQAKPHQGLQYAALPWRTKDGKLEILLITSRESKRWIIPKGWPIKSLSPAASAAQEAFEEAGVVGKISFQVAGAYHYFKRLKQGIEVPCKVEVYPLEVLRCRRDWPEKEQRELRWFSAQEASTAVTEGELKLLIRRFARAHDRAAQAVAVK